MRILAIAVVSMAVLFGMNDFAFAQSPPAKDTCLKISLDHDGAQQIQEVTLEFFKDTHRILPTGGCFKIPGAWLTHDRFVIRLESNEGSYFLGPIFLEDFYNPLSVTAIVTEGSSGNTRTDDAGDCRIVFQHGEPERAEVVHPCWRRKPASTIKK